MKMIHAGTNSMVTAKPLTMEDIKKVAVMTYYKPELPIVKDYKKSFLEKMMNRFGWFKQYEVIIVDVSKFKLFPQS